MLFFGFLTRLGGVLGSVMSMVFLSGAIDVDWVFTYLLLIVGFFTCAWARSGRWYGIDYWLKDWLPDSFAWLLV